MEEQNTTRSTCTGEEEEEEGQKPDKDKNEWKGNDAR